MSQFDLEKLLEKRDSYLNDEEIKQIKEMEKNTINELDKIQQEISQIISKNPS